MRPVSAEALDQAIEAIEAKLRQCGEKEIDSTLLGEWVMKELRKRRFYEKPTTRRRRKKAEARIRWLRKKSTLELW